MKSSEVRRHIAADAQEIWATLTDPERLVAAGTGIARIEGRIEPDLQPSFEQPVDGLARSTEGAR